MSVIKMENPEYYRIQIRIAGVLTEKLAIEAPPEDADLFETGILDSQKFVELLLHIEQQFGTHIAIEDFEIENFRSIDRIATLILNHRNAGKIDNDASAVDLEHR
jgi:methoxymalonate biosynthesis acyl carrier protein